MHVRVHDYVTSLIIFFVFCTTLKKLIHGSKSRLAINNYNFLVHFKRHKNLRQNDVMGYETVVILKWVLS